VIAVTDLFKLAIEGRGGLPRWEQISRFGLLHGRPMERMNARMAAATCRGEEIIVRCRPGRARAEHAQARRPGRGAGREIIAEAGGGEGGQDDDGAPG
jgi:hypothetical protein